tara:strand:- start:189 stop:1208 length:1020 start_codon:yes stop_codon:yes gene_type:complete
MKKNSCFIIAEIGVNHNNNMSLAKKLITEAKKTGADAVKFQTFKADTLALKKTPKVPYQKRSGSIKESHHLMLKKLELSKKDHFILKKFCEKEKIEFISTPYDINSARFLDNLGVKTFKVASADIVDHQLHEFLAKKKKKVIISTGMASMKEIKEVLQIYKSNKNNKFSLLHCVSNYPCSDKSLNLKNIITLNKIFKCKIGFSDHSVGNQAAIMSIGYGAHIIEKHFTLNKNMKGPDQLASSTPKEFRSLVKDVRRAENMRGSHLRKLQKEEIIMKKISRKSLIYNNNLLRNHILSENDISLIRPGTGILGNNFKYFVGKKLKKKVKKFEQIKFAHVKK